MSFEDLMRDDRSAHRILVEAQGTPFAPCADTRPVVDVLGGRCTHDELEPTAWLDAVKAADGRVAVYFYLAADHEWWLAYDADPDPDRYETDDEPRIRGPWHRWTTYPSGPWEHCALPRGILEHNLADIYWLHDPDDRCDIYRSKVVPVRETPDWLRETIRRP